MLNEVDVMEIVMARMGSGSGVISVSKELRGVLLDISARADFLTQESQTVTVAGQAEYDEPEGLKRIYECYINGTGLLEKKTFRNYLEETANGTATGGQPTKYAIRHGKVYLWPVPDSEYNIEVDYSTYHPEAFTDISFGPEFNEAIYEGVIAALYQGQLFEKLRLAEKKIAAKDGQTNTTSNTDTTTETDQEATDDDTTTLIYKFSKDFPEIQKHRQVYENEIAKLIANLDIDTETVLVEYRDI
jgi:hypothetical protein